MREHRRHRRGRGPHEDPRQVPAGARGRGVGPASRVHLRQGVPAHLRRHARARRADAGRRVQAPVQDPSELELAPVLPARGESRRGRERPADHPRERDRERGRPPAPPRRPVHRACWPWRSWSSLIAAALFVVHELRKKTRRAGSQHDHTTTTTRTTTQPPTRAAPRRVARRAGRPALVYGLPDRLPHAHRRRRRARRTPCSIRGGRAAGLPRRQPLPRQLRPAARRAWSSTGASITRGRQHRARSPTRSSSAATSSSCRPCRARTARERPRGDRRHRHRGAQRARQRPQRPLARRAAGRARASISAHMTIVGDRPADMLAALRGARAGRRR